MIYIAYKNTDVILIAPWPDNYQFYIFSIIRKHKNVFHHHFFFYISVYCYILHERLKDLFASQSCIIFTKDCFYSHFYVDIQNVKLRDSIVKNYQLLRSYVRRKFNYSTWSMVFVISVSIHEWRKYRNIKYHKVTHRWWGKFSWYCIVF